MAAYDSNVSVGNIASEDCSKSIFHWKVFSVVGGVVMFPLATLLLNVVQKVFSIGKYFSWLVKLQCFRWQLCLRKLFKKYFPLESIFRDGRSCYVSVGNIASECCSKSIFHWKVFFVIGGVAMFPVATLLLKVDQKVFSIGNYLGWRDWSRNVWLVDEGGKRGGPMGTPRQASGLQVADGWGMLAGRQARWPDGYPEA
ncbi:MAG: hypothetical protein ACI4AM_09740, partial [Muribaculaceae bacterium]